MTKELALRPQYAQYPNPNLKPKLFGQTRPEPDPKSKSPTRQGLHMSHILLSLLTSFFCSDKLGCQEGSPLGSDYSGNASITVSGRTCQKWSVQTPHTHGWTDQGDHNYCRNPDRESGAWCYTTDPDVRWELCLVPECDSLPQTGKTLC